MTEVHTFPAPAPLAREATALEIVVAMEQVRQRVARELALLGGLALDLRATRLSEDAGDWFEFVEGDIRSAAEEMSHAGLRLADVRAVLEREARGRHETHTRDQKRPGWTFPR
jgi:hypothetical protein